MGCANNSNQLAAIKYVENNLQIIQSHNKQHNIWIDLLPFDP